MVVLFGWNVFDTLLTKTSPSGNKNIRKANVMLVSVWT
jgi:hypothetical protein